MSAPTVAVALADAIAPLAQAMQEALGAHAYVHWFAPNGEHPGFFQVGIHDHGRCFSGSDYTSAGLALMAANSERQAWEETALKSSWRAA